VPVPAFKLMAKEGDYALLRMPSGELRKVHINCRATIGQIGNLDSRKHSLGKLVVVVGWVFALLTARSNEPE